MKKSVLLFLILLFGVVPFAKGAEPETVLMNIDGKEVMMSEFEYFLNKNRNSADPLSKKELKEYSDLYVNFKLKVAAAERAGLDTMATFKEEYKLYRDMQAETYMLDSAYLEEMAFRTYETSAKEVGPDGLVNLNILTIVPDGNSQEDLLFARNKIDSLYNIIVNKGANFNEIAARNSQDGVASDGGIVGWVSRAQVPEYIAERAFTMPVNMVSEPFYCEMGFMIIRITEKQSFGSYEEHRASIYEWMEREGYNVLAKRSKARKVAKEYGWTNLTDDQAIARVDSMLEDIYPEFGLISQEYYDGLLMFEISNNEVWQRSTIDTLGLERFFEKNKKQFKFEKPRFKGMLFFCKSEQVFHDIVAAIDGCNDEERIAKIAEFNREEPKVRILRGPIEKGKNKYVDSVVFGEGEYELREDYPYVDVIGKAISYPEEISDSYGEVVNAYQDYLEKMWIKRLHKEIPYKVNKKVLNSIIP